MNFTLKVLFIFVLKFNNRMPSSIKYQNSITIEFNWGKFITWYLGIDSTYGSEHIFNSNNHTLLLDKNLKNKYISYTDPNLISIEFKTGRSYYKSYENFRNQIFPTQLDDSNILFQNKSLASMVSKVFSSDISPGLVDAHKLKRLPKAYFVLCEMDPLKDEGFIYSERLLKQGVEVEVAFYEHCYHGIAPMVDKDFGFLLANKMQDDLIKYIKANI